MTVTVPDPPGMPDVHEDLAAAARARRERHEQFGTLRDAPLRWIARLVAQLGDAAPHAGPAGPMRDRAANERRLLDYRLALLDVAAEALIAIESVDRGELALYHGEQARAAAAAAAREQQP